MSGLSLIVGLGNPGRQYEQTRHNAGFWLLDEIVRDCGGSLRAESRFHGYATKVSIVDRPVWLLKPETFMNLSGKAVAALSRFYKIPAEQILVLHDELDFPPGTVRLKKGGGAGGHNGVSDIRSQGESYVLKKPPPAEFEAIMDVLYRTRTYVPDLVAGNFSQVMNELHRNPETTRTDRNKKRDSNCAPTKTEKKNPESQTRPDSKGEN